MPDLMIEHIWTCAQNLHFELKVTGSTGKIYTVRYGRNLDEQYQYGWSCDCPARVECKHIKAAKLKRCDWNWEAFMGSHAEPRKGNLCPKCGGPCEVIKVGV